MARGETRGEGRGELRERSKQTSQMRTSISDALRQLDQHATGQGEQLFNLFSSGFNAIRQLITSEITPRVKETLREATGEHLEGSRNVISRLNEEIRENPWRVAGGMAISALFLGYFMGRTNKSPMHRLRSH